MAFDLTGYDLQQWLREDVNLCLELTASVFFHSESCHCVTGTKCWSLSAAHTAVPAQTGKED